MFEHIYSRRQNRFHFNQYKEKRERKREKSDMAKRNMAIYEKFTSVHIWWFPKDFCQSRFGHYQESGNNSCTLISLIYANKLCKMPTFSQSESQMPPLAWVVIGDAINEGNRVYHDLIHSNVNISVPSALWAIRTHHKTKFCLEEWFFTHLGSDPTNHLYVARELAEVLTTGVTMYQQADIWDKPRYLFACIVADCRASMISIDLENGVVGMIDSHPHGDCGGAVLCQCNIENMEDMMFNFVSMLDTIYSSRPELYEISFLCSLPNVKRRIPRPIDEYANDLSKYKEERRAR